MDAEEVNITNAKCEICKESVEPEIGFNMCWTHHEGKRKTIMENGLHTCWHCKNHGGVGAFIGRKYYPKPEDVFHTLRLLEKQKKKVTPNE